MMVLRRLLGSVLRRQRQRQGRTLREVSAEAQVSLGYLSEVERGEKEASSELLAAICAALELPLSAILREVSDELAQAEASIGMLTPMEAPAAGSIPDAVPDTVPDTMPDSIPDPLPVASQRIETVQQMPDVVVAA